ncbi:MAG TPA: TIGR00159 family protein [Lentisphaeria bacterium]|nr:MAG: TIGR00159 family protein [Lentisphaerae bacterium GWF2_49_21]HBC85987.1 TIGR00159 family protein [Lentisphaeria bacterium]
MSEFVPYLSNAWIYLSFALEVLILAVLIYYGLYFLRGTRAANVLAGIVIALLLLTLATDFLKFEVLTELLNGLWMIFPLALVVIFQPEIRRAFAQLGSSRPFAKRLKKEETINEVVKAVEFLSMNRRGALIVFQRQIGMRALISSGIRVNARVSHQLIQTIFHPNTPLHDGAIAIEDNEIVAAHIIFPLTQSVALSDSLGTRHRAAIGVTEETDSVAVVVSEETGNISIACRGNIIRNISSEKLLRFLRSLLIPSQNDSIRDIFEDMSENDEMSGFTGGQKDE